MAGRYFDEWTIGDRIAHDIRRTITETDNLGDAGRQHIGAEALALDAVCSLKLGEILRDMLPADVLNAAPSQIIHS